MIALVDYDNISRADRRRGVVYVAEKILLTLGASLAAKSGRVRMRLYGGWYERTALSRRAQHLAVEIAGHFPRAVTVASVGPSVTLPVAVELASSLECEPAKVLTHTFRLRSVVGNVECHGVPFAGCLDAAACPIAVINPLFRTGTCPIGGCPVDLERVLFRAEQKLVDTMLIADLIYLARSWHGQISVVSTDDDVWPGIAMAVSYGANVLHVHPVRGRSTPAHYRQGVGASYSEHQFN